MTHAHSVTCDICGETAEVSGDSTFGGCYGPNWLRVVGTGPLITGDMPHEHRSKQPDLCSWKCVAEYAGRFASGAGAAHREPVAAYVALPAGLAVTPTQARELQDALAEIAALTARDGYPRKVLFLPPGSLSEIRQP